MDLDLQRLQTALQHDHFSQLVARLPPLETDSALYRSPTLPDLPEFEVHLFEQVPSTNSVAWDLLHQGAPAGTVVIALAQTAGRGQWGHQWQSSVGGVYLSLGMKPNLPVAQAGQLTLSSTWGVATALRDWGIPVQIKWFNDLVMREQNHLNCLTIRKLGGILAETRIAQEHIRQAVIGVGINWRNAVPSGGINLKTILDTQSSPNPTAAINSLEMLAAIVLQGLKFGYTYWQQVDCIIGATAYEKLLVNLGQSITFAGKRGVIRGITPTGQLRVLVEDDIGASEVCLPPGSVSLGYGKQNKG